MLMTSHLWKGEAARTQEAPSKIASSTRQGCLLISVGARSSESTRQVGTLSMAHNSPTSAIPLSSSFPIDTPSALYVGFGLARSHQSGSFLETGNVFVRDPFAISQNDTLPCKTKFCSS